MLNRVHRGSKTWTFSGSGNCSRCLGEIKEKALFKECEFDGTREKPKKEVFCDTCGTVIFEELKKSKTDLATKYMADHTTGSISWVIAFRDETPFKPKRSNFGYGDDEE